MIDPQKTDLLPLASWQTRLWRWITVLTAALLFCYHFFQMNLLNTLGPFLMRDFSMNAAQLGNLSATFFIANFIFVFPAGMILDRSSPRQIVLLSMLCIILSVFGLACATHIETLILSRIFAGIGGAFAFISCMRLAASWFPQKRLALVTGGVTTIAMLGGIAAQTPAILAIQLFGGWRPMLIAVGIIGLVMFILMGVLVRDYPKKYRIAKTVKIQNIKQIGLWGSIFSTLSNKYNWLIGFYIALVNLPWMLLGSLWGTFYLSQTHHFSEIRSSYAILTLFVGLMIGSLIIGWLSDRLRCRINLMIVGALCACGLICTIMYGLHFKLQLLMVLFFLLGLTTSTQILGYPLIAELNSPFLIGTALSITSILIMASGFIFQPLFGYLLDLHWNHLIRHGIPIYSIQNFQLALWLLPIALITSIFSAIPLKIKRSTQ